MNPDSPRPARVVLLTAIAMIAFASNSILCRVALRGGAIDPATFTALRIVSGAVALFLVVRAARVRTTLRAERRSGWPTALLLFAYAIAFSLAYLALSAGTGALLLFGSVQTTMLVGALRSGERPRAREWTGLAVAIAGLVWLTFPSLTAPPIAGSLLMVGAGIAWGQYTLLGRGSRSPIRDTAANFLLASPVALLACALLPALGRPLHVTPAGVLYALASGVVASGFGYAVWYTALRGLTATRAATVQLSVPVVAAFGGVVLLGETISPRLGIAAGLILGGIGLALAGRRPARSALRATVP